VGFAMIANKKGDERGNAKLKAITKAKRRTTLSICGLGCLDETEVETIPAARTYTADAVPETFALPPAAAEHPTQEQIDYLFQLAESCREPKEAFGSQLRRIMGLSGDTRINKKYLGAHMSLEHYTAAEAHYTAMLKVQVEQDVPDSPPPELPAASGPSEPVAATEPTPAPDSAEQDRAIVRALALGWGLPASEVDHVLSHHRDPQKARDILWRARQQREQKPAPQPSLTAAD
jgi:hypothetical protein